MGKEETDDILYNVNLKSWVELAIILFFKLLTRVFKVPGIKTGIKISRIFMWRIFFTQIRQMGGCSRSALLVLAVLPFIFKVWVQWKVASMLVLCYLSHQSNSHLPWSESLQNLILSSWNTLSQANNSNAGKAATVWILWLPVRGKTAMLFMSMSYS